MAKTHAWHCGPGQKQSKAVQTRSRQPDGAKLSQTFVEHGGVFSEGVSVLRRSPRGLRMKKWKIYGPQMANRCRRFRMLQRIVNSWGWYKMGWGLGLDQTYHVDAWIYVKYGLQELIGAHNEIAIFFSEITREIPKPFVNFP